MLSINQLMEYLRNHHQISVKNNQAQSLRNIGYYHGYKGYRFIRVPSQRIHFPSLDEVIALNKFDAYIILITYILRKMGETQAVCEQFVTSFVECTDLLRTQISSNVCNQVLGTQQRTHLNQLQNFIGNS